MKFSDIPKYPFTGYQTTVDWDFLKDYLNKRSRTEGFILQPDYQRGHVWSKEQQIAYCENMMRGSQAGRDILFNNPSWMGEYNQPTECLDGQQRITAVLAFLNDEIKCFGHFFSEYEESLHHCVGTFTVHVLKVEDREELIKLYIAINTGGSYHSEEDLKTAYEALQAAKC